MGTAHLLQLLSLFTGILVLPEVRSWNINVPKTITAVEGSCVMVPCQTEPHSRVVWYQYHSLKYLVVYDGHHSFRILHEFRGRTSVPGKAAEGNCSLVISNVKTADNNLQIYVWINPDSSTAQKFHEQLVTIFVEKTPPKISIQKQIVEGETFHATCSINYSCPFSPPSLHWNSPFLESSTLMASDEKVQGQWSHTETMHGLATYKMHNSKMRCSAQFLTFIKESEQTLNISYKPVRVTLMQENYPVREGGSVIMECAANCNPQPHTYSWLKRQMGQTTKIKSAQRKTLFNNVTRDTSVSCIAHNDIGAGQSDWLDLDVQYAPAVLPASSCHLTGEVLKCVCQAEASPHASISWTIDGNDTLPSSFSTVSTNEKNVVFEEMSWPAQSQSDISCTATNSLGSNTKQLSVDKPSSVSVWLTAALLPGIVFLLGCVMLIYRKCSINRPGSVCNAAICLRPQFSLEPEVTNNNIPRSQGEDIQSSPYQPESVSEVDRPTDVYDNDFVDEMRATRAKQHQDNAIVDQRREQIQPLEEAVDCNMSDYLNC